MPSKLTTAELLAQARWQAARHVPYLARSLYAMTFVETDAVPTLAVDDRWRVYFNEEYIHKCAAEGTLVGELFHECLHPTLRHSSRSKVIGATDHKHWNGAADAELDQQIEAAFAVIPKQPFRLVDDRVRPECFEGGAGGMTAEELYKLPRKSKSGGKPGKDGKCTCGGGSGAGVPLPFEGKPGKAQVPSRMTNRENLCLPASPTPKPTSSAPRRRTRSKNTLKRVAARCPVDYCDGRKNSASPRL